MISKAVRDLVWDRAGDCCERCGRGLTRLDIHSLHHRKFRSRLGQDTVDNLVLLCGDGSSPGCHRFVHNDKLGEEQGFVVASWQNPQLVPITHWSGRDLYLLPDGTLGEQVWEAS